MGGVDQGIMGTPAAAHAKLVGAARAWREFRQPLMATATEHRKHDAAEREARFQLANAALLWLWHIENPTSTEERCVASVAISSAEPAERDSSRDTLSRLQRDRDALLEAARAMVKADEGHSLSERNAAWAKLTAAISAAEEAKP